jgi:RNA-directed DNA polymerase
MIATQPTLQMPDLLGQAYLWLCRLRAEASPHHGIWHLRATWATLFPAIRDAVEAGRYLLSPVRVIRTKDGSLLECWEPQDSLVLKATALSLEPLLLPRLSRKCYHLKDRGGVKAAVNRLKSLVRCGRYSYVARSDARGYYANIQHTRLLELLREEGPPPAVMSLVSQYCRRLRVRDGYYAETEKGISLGCPLSPLMGALYLSPLDRAMEKLPGIRYLRFMDDWVILAESKWKLRRAVRVMNQVLTRLGLEQHPDKTFIGRLERGFDFLGIQFTGRGVPSPSAVSLARHTEKTARLYEQGASQERIEQYRQNWRSYLRGILGDEAPATKIDRNGTNPPPRTMPQSVLSSLNHSHRTRQSCTGAKEIKHFKNGESKTEQTRILPWRDRWGMAVLPAWR